MLNIGESDHVISLQPLSGYYKFGNPNVTVIVPPNTTGHVKWQTEKILTVKFRLNGTILVLVPIVETGKCLRKK
jgi:hypothetical protein